MTRVSVIIPVFNTAETAIKLVVSMLKGTYKNLEFILVNDGSTDDSLPLLKEFVRQFNISKRTSKSPVSIKLLNEANLGPSAARNYGLEKATGDYIAFIDSDDSVSKSYIKKMLAGLIRYDKLSSKELKPSLTCCGYHYNRTDKKGKSFDLYTNPVDERFPDETLRAYILRLLNTDGRLYACHNKLYRADIIRKYDLHFDEKMNFAEDTKFVLEYLAAASREHFTRIAFINEPLYIYNYGTKHSIVKNTSLSWGNWEKSFKFLKKWCGKNPTEKEQKLLRKIYHRWILSHALAVARSKQSFGHKCNHVSPFLLIPAEIVVKFRH